jgi:hypothetical protein
MLAEAANKPQEPLHATVVLPKDSIKIVLPSAPKPQAIHIHTKEIRTREAVDKLVMRAPVKLKPAPALKVRDPETEKVVKKSRGKLKPGELPPPANTPLRKIWDEKHGKE